MMSKFNYSAIIALLFVNYLSAKDCSTIEVKSGDSCASLANRCKIPGHKFDKYNPGICGTLQPGQRVCCTEGTLPDIRPKPKPDGECFTYKVQSDEWCDKIATANGIKSEDIEKFNKKTYGWLGCEALMVDQTICLSEGKPFRPPSNPKAECGPLAPGKKYNSTCPLNACCSDWGYCGIGDEHCKKTPSKTGAPGTTGCYTNCDRTYVKGDPPSEFIKVGYYESWTINWPCMNGGVESVDFSDYTHVHFSFVDLRNGNIWMDDAATSEFDKFKQMDGFKKILSIGGWEYSTNITMHNNIRRSIDPGNVDATASNIASFLSVNGLDGIDIDWEYPGVPEGEAIPPGEADDAKNYLTFVATLRNKIPRSKSVSIAAPASYWYLKPFLIEDMSKYLNYIVFMTYDLHGQWDYTVGKDPNPLLLSHTNWTETSNALTLITRAGVPSNKVLLGIAAYGRSFQQQIPDCSGPTCKFTGPDSGATPGKCTGTKGYLSYNEISKIDSSRIRNKWTDEGSEIMTYDNDQWISWLSKDQMKERENKAREMNLGGTIVWAADLLENDGLGEVLFDLSLSSLCSDYEDDTIDSLGDDVDEICTFYALSFALYNSGKKALEKYNELLNNNYKDMFNNYQDVIYNGLVEKLYSWLFVKRVFGRKDMDFPNGPIVDHFNCEKGPCSFQKECYMEKCNRGKATFKDKDRYFKDLSEKLGTPVTESMVSYGRLSVKHKFSVNTCDAPGRLEISDDMQRSLNNTRDTCKTFDLDKDLEIEDFPVLVKEKVIPNPMNAISGNYTDIENLVNSITDEYDDFEYSSVYYGARYSVLSLIESVNSMEDAYNKAKEIKDMQEQEKKKAVTSLVLGIVFTVIAFLPIPGAAIIGEIGQIASAAAMGSTDFLDYLPGAIGIAGDVLSMTKKGAKLVEVADKVMDLERHGNNAMRKILKNNPKFQKMKSVTKKFCKKKP